MRLPTLVDHWRASLLDALVPRLCLYCREPSSAPVCDGCRADLPWNRSACPRCAQPRLSPTICPDCLARPPAFDAAHASFVLEAPVQQGLWGLKYRARFEQSRALGLLMAQALRERAAPLPQVLIPVPLHRRRLFTRGYNQALELARVLSRELDVPVNHRCVQRTRMTTDQIGQSAAQRRRNMRGAFTAERLDGLQVALIDDVMTTGATLDALAKACRKAGAVRIEAWAAARTR